MLIEVLFQNLEQPVVFSATLLATWGSVTYYFQTSQTGQQFFLLCSNIDMVPEYLKYSLDNGVL